MPVKGASPIKKGKPFYGYTIVLSCFLITAVTFGVNYSFGIFFDPFISEFGWNRAEISLAFALATVLSGFLGIGAGKITDALGPRPVNLVGGLCLASGCFLMTYMHSLGQLYLYFGLLVGIGIGSGFPSLMATVSRWFRIRRGAMTSIVAAGTGVGTMIIPLVASRLLLQFDWRLSLRLMSGAVLILAVTAALFLKRDPAVIGCLPDGAVQPQGEKIGLEDAGTPLGKAILSNRFRAAGALYFTIGYCTQGVMVHVVPHALESGINPARAATVIFLIGVGSILGRLGMGILSDRIQVRGSTILTLVTWFIAFLWLPYAADLRGLYLFALLFGASYGALLGLAVLISAQMFGLLSLGTITAAIMFLYTCGGAIGPALTGYLFDLTGGYREAFIIFLGLALAALMISLLLKPGDWQDTASEREQQP
ncbi:MAG: MFS transporter [Firmicutes bacterium]|nr:MFS transporter [Bacillota bacterium]